MTGTHNSFTNRSKMDLDLHVDLGTHAKCGVEGVGIVRFQLESRGSMEVAYVLHVSELNMNFLSVSVMEGSGYTIFFKDGWVLIRSKGSDIDSTQVLSVREGNVYRF
jgi:hypothetical protein